MRDGWNSYKIFAYAVLVLFFLSVIIFGLGGYYAGLGSDPYGIVHFADHLSRGKIYSDFPVYNWFKQDWKPGESHFVLHGNYVISEGKMYCKYTIGFPLLLAAAINLFGSGSVYYANVFILLVLLWFHFRLARVVFFDRPEGLLLAVLSPIMLAVMIGSLWELALRPSHDLSALMFIVAGCYLGIMALRRLPRVNYIYLISGAFCLGFSASIRLPDVLVGIPALGYLMARMAGKVKFTRFVAVIIVALFFFSAALGPAFIQNYLSTGNPLKPPRPEIVERNPMKVEGELTPPPLWLGFFKTTAPDTAAYFWRLYGPLFAVLILIGLFSEWRKPEVKFLVLGIPLIFVLFYSMWVHLMTRYMLIAQPFLIILAVGGIGKLIRGKKHFLLSIAFLLLAGIDAWFRWKWRYQFGMADLNVFIFILAGAIWLAATWNWKKLTGAIRLGGLCLIALALFMAKYAPAWAGSARLFQLPEARRFGADIDRVVEKGSVIFATKPASNYIALFSGSYSIRPFEINRVGVDQVEGLNRLLDRGVKLYLIDSSGWKRDTTKAIPAFREHFDVIPVGEFRPGDYFLEGSFGKPVCTIYRIRRWEENKVEIGMPVPPGSGDYLLMLDVGRIFPEKTSAREWVKIRLNGRVLTARPDNGINYFRIPEALLSRPESQLEITSDLPLPSMMDFRLQPLSGKYIVNLAGQLKFPDLSLTDGFNEARLRDSELVRLGWNKPGRVIIPTVPLPGAGLCADIKVKNDRNFPDPVRLEASLNGHKLRELALPRGLGWETISIPLPERYISSARSSLDLTASPSPGHRLSAGEERTGALLFEEIAIERRLEKVSLPAPRPGAYFLGFSFLPAPGMEGSDSDYRIVIDDQVILSGLSPGVQRVVIPAGVVAAPVSELRVLSGGEGVAAPINHGLVFLPAGEEVTVNLGDETDRAFIKDGFFAPEIHLGEVPVRWTGKTARLVIPLSRTSGGECRLRLSMKIVNPGPPRRDGPDVMDVSLDGESLGSITLEPGERVYSLDMSAVPPPDNGQIRLAELKMTVPDWSPSRYMGTGDNRRLGVMLDWIKIRCE